MNAIALALQVFVGDQYHSLCVCRATPLPAHIIDMLDSPVYDKLIPMLCSLLSCANKNVVEKLGMIAALL